MVAPLGLLRAMIGLQSDDAAAMALAMADWLASLGGKAAADRPEAEHSASASKAPATRSRDGELAHR